MPTKQPYEILIKFENNSTSRSSKRKQKAEMRRSKTGCFNCRKIKKKCSETRPCCQRCLGKGLLCVWPSSKTEKLPVGFVIMKEGASKCDDNTIKSERNKLDSNSMENGMPHESSSSSQPMSREEIHLESLITDDTDNDLKASQYLRILDEFKFQATSITLTNKSEQIAASPMSLSSLINDSAYDFLTGSSFNTSTLPAAAADYNITSNHNTAKIYSIDSPSRHYQSLEEYESTPSTPNIPMSIAIRTSLNTKSQFMYACLNGFISAVAPQYTHPSLTTTATFTRIFDQANMNNTILEQVAYACGAAFLSWNKDDITSIAMDLYDAAYGEITVLIERVDHMERDELIWICGASQMLWLCGKILAKTGDFNLMNLKNTYKVIKARLKQIEVEKRKLTSKTDTDKEQTQTRRKGDTSSSSSSSKSSSSSFALDMLSMEIENECLGSKVSMFKNTGRDNGLSLSRNQFERMFIESFIYNYSITLIKVVDINKLTQLPNPFQVFKELRTFLKIPIFKCEVAWMNNPVLGAATDAFELIGKTSYLLRQLDNPLTVPMAEKLMDIASFYPSSIIPLEIKAQSEEKYINLKESVLMSDIAFKCCKILLTKIIKFDLTHASSPEIQKEVKDIVAKFKLFTRGALVKRISPWALFITGLVCVNSDEKEFIIRELVDVGYDTHSRHINTIVNVLRNSWSSKDRGNPTGFDVLWSEDIMNSICL